MKDHFVKGFHTLGKTSEDEIVDIQCSGRMEWVLNTVSPRGLGASEEKMVLHSFSLELKVRKIPQTTIFHKISLLGPSWLLGKVVFWFKMTKRSCWKDLNFIYTCSKLWTTLKWTDGPRSGALECNVLDLNRFEYRAWICSGLDWWSLNTSNEALCNENRWLHLIYILQKKLLQRNSMAAIPKI